MLTDQQKQDYYYGYNLRLADELGEFDNYINQPNTLKGKIELSRKLEGKLLEGSKENTHMREAWSEKKIITEIFNPEL